MRRPGFLGDLDGFWFSGLGLVTDAGKEPEPWLRIGRDFDTPYIGAGIDPRQREAELTELSRAQGWLTTGPVKQHYQLPVATPHPSRSGNSWTPFHYNPYS